MGRALVASHDPEEIVSLIKFFQGVSPPVRLTSLCSHWQLTRNLREFHRGLPQQWQDRMFVHLAKALELRSLKLFAPSLLLFHAVEAELRLPRAWQHCWWPRCAIQRPCRQQSHCHYQPVPISLQILLNWLVPPYLHIMLRLTKIIDHVKRWLNCAAHCL
ncbi:uncharacterized protein LOC125756549 [Rhipicephalus sanguineus]|uniref:uncharacterized protein LOC125756549 n=1 Tax=Rhipicephalus sanguineus TaxID=34632 RepID=UPI0020C38914|nr:uncharacterized protein LOC125756549 [Rhipicephalus sanguineus]